LYTGNDDRQRNEIKAYDKSVDTAKGAEGETVRYHWFFRLADDFAVSPSFTHFMQIKAYDNAGGGFPILTITGYVRSGIDQLEIRHASGNSGPSQALTRYPLESLRGQWLEVSVIATYADDGYLRVEVKNAAGQSVIDIEETLIDMWHNQALFNRPKWGIYRSLLRLEYLTNATDTVDFADFALQKILPN
jgi:hypothetical protein